MRCVNAHECRERPAAGAPPQVAVELPAGHEVAVLVSGPFEHAGDQIGILEVAVVLEPHGGHLVVGYRAESVIGVVGLAERDAVEAVGGQMVAEIALAGRQAVTVLRSTPIW